MGSINHGPATTNMRGGDIRGVVPAVGELNGEMVEGGIRCEHPLEILRIPGLVAGHVGRGRGG